MSNFALKASIALALTPSMYALAQEPTVLLDEIVVTATRSPANASQIPARVSVIGEKEINQNPTLNLSDVLQKDASVFNRSQWGGVGQPSSLSLRGTNATHTLVLKDGARLNSQNGTAPLYPAFLDLTDVERIEVVKGPASVQYGSDAIGGVVQMISKTPTKTGVSATGVWGENHTYKAIVQGDLVAGNGLYASVSGQRLESDGTRIFSNQPKHDTAGFEQKGYNAKVGYNNKQNLDASVSISQNEGVNEYSNTGYLSAPQIDSQREFENRIITAKASYKINDQFTLSGRHSNIKDTQHITDTYGKDQYDTENNDSDVNVKWSFAPNQNLLAGVSYLSSEYDSNNIANKHQENDSIGYYAQHQYNSDKINTQLGVRYEDNDRFGGHTVGQGAIRYHFTPATSIYANVGSAFRSPTLEEMYSTWYIANPNLKPEESFSYEFGLDHKLTPNTALQLSAYRNEVKNLIRTACLSDTSSGYCWGNSSYINIDKATFTGGELGVKWAKDDFYATAQYAYVKTENDSNGNVNKGKELAYRPQHNGVVVLGYDNGQYGVNTTVTAHSKSYANAVNTIKVGGYATVDVNAHWHINPNIKLFTNIKNLGDVQYKSSYYGPNWYINGGREANIGVTFSY